MRFSRSLRIQLGVGLVLAAALFLGASAARADYGGQAAYQVEISSNPQGFGVWLWAELDPSGTSGDYQETDCIHLGGGHVVNGEARDAAAHDSGSVSAWSVDTNAGTLTMYGVNLVGGAETADITVPLPSSGQYGHSHSVMITPENGSPPIIAGTFPAQVQLAP
jgi:hypothetical protein